MDMDMDMDDARAALSDGGAEEEEEAHGPLRLREWLSETDVRLCPPATFPAGVIDLVRSGDQLDLFYDDGWWEVDVKEVLHAHQKGGGGGGGGPRFSVQATKYNKTHKDVTADRLRPRWLYAAQARAWRFELLSGHGCAPVDGSVAGGKPTFKFAAGVLRTRHFS